MKTGMGWHFLGSSLRYGDGRTPKKGEWLRAQRLNGTPFGPTARPELCASGMHASDRVLDAATYAPLRARLCRVEVRGPMTWGGLKDSGGDKFAGVERRVVEWLSVKQTEAFIEAMKAWWRRVRVLYGGDLPWKWQDGARSLWTLRAQAGAATERTAALAALDKQIKRCLNRYFKKEIA